ncbi:MAG: hypothetical protein KJZ83_00510 [Burkholderiaceae bacterium]|nr:hypothetical protein [Burkholderiaceae bacterium]
MSTFVDIYWFRAQVFPALWAVGPALVLAGVMTNWDDVGAAHAAGTSAFGVVLFALADISRRLGRRKEPEIFAIMGGKPSMTLLRHRDVHLDAGAKARVHAFLGGAAGLTMPTVKDETERPHECDCIYEACGGWLRENTRDAKTYKLLKVENITFGYRRNLLGLKPGGIAVGLLVLAAVVVLLWRYGFGALGDEHSMALVGVGVAALVQLGYFIVFVTEDAVREAARQYGRQLILCCEVMREVA